MCSPEGFGPVLSRAWPTVRVEDYGCDVSETTIYDRDYYVDIQDDTPVRQSQSQSVPSCRTELNVRNIDIVSRNSSQLLGLQLIWILVYLARMTMYCLIAAAQCISGFIV